MILTMKENKEIIPKSGAWVLISQEIPVEAPIDPMSVYYAVPTGKIFWDGELEGWFKPSIYDDGTPSMMMNEIGLKWRAFDIFKDMAYQYLRGKYDGQHKERFDEWKELGWLDNVITQQVKIKTVFEDVCIQPHEYRVIQDMSPYIEPIKEGHVFIRWMTNQKQLSGKVADQIFYLRSRGIAYTEALQLCIGNIKSQNLFYLEFHPAYQESFTRNYDRYWARKMNYCIKKHRQDLLNYGPTWDFSNTEKQLIEDEQNA